MRHPTLLTGGPVERVVRCDEMPQDDTRAVFPLESSPQGCRCVPLLSVLLCSSDLTKLIAESISNFLPALVVLSPTN